MLSLMQTCLEHTSIYMYTICSHLSEEDLLIDKVNIAVGFYKEWKTIIFIAVLWKSLILLSLSYYCPQDEYPQAILEKTTLYYTCEWKIICGMILGKRNCPTIRVTTCEGFRATHILEAVIDSENKLSPNLSNPNKEQFIPISAPYH